MTQSDKEDLTRVMWPASHTSYGYFTKFGGNLTTDKNAGIAQLANLFTPVGPLVSERFNFLYLD